MLSHLWKCRKTSKNKGKKTFLKKIQKSVDNYHNLSYTVQAVASETKNKQATHWIRGLSSAGRASALQAEGHRFEPCRPHPFQLNMAE